MKTLIEDLKKVMNSEIDNKDKYMEMLIKGFLRERDTEQLIIADVVGSENCNICKKSINFIPCCTELKIPKTTKKQRVQLNEGYNKK